MKLRAFLVLAIFSLAACDAFKLENRLLSEKPNVRASAMKRVRMMPVGNRAALVPPMIAALGTEGPKSSRALDALIAIGDPAVDPLVSTLQNADPYIKATVVSVLGEIASRPETLIPEFVSALDDPHPLVREEAAHALGRLGQRGIGAIPALHATLNDPKPEVQEAAASALQKLGVKNVVIPGKKDPVSKASPAAPGRPS